jgi:hypothetical protein
MRIQAAAKRYLRVALLPAIGIGVILLIVWIVGSSETFHDCVEKAKHDQPYEALYKNVATSFGSAQIERLRLNRACAGDFAEKEQGPITALATAVVATFTALLWSVTDRLARATQIAAEAAKASAEVIPNIERPYVFVYETPISARQPAIQMIGHTLTRDLPQAAVGALRFINYGRTPANIDTFKVFLEYLDHIPVDADTERLLAIPASGTPADIFAVIASDKIWTCPTFESANAPDSAMWAAFQKGAIGLYCWGSIGYRDVFRNVHTTYFCRKYDLRTGGLTVVGGFARNRVE